jgi:nitroreductase
MPYLSCGRDYSFWPEPEAIPAAGEFSSVSSRFDDVIAPARSFCQSLYPQESQMDVVEAIYGRRSIRSYAQRPVERDLIEAIILDAAQAPPPTSGVVPWTFNVILGIERIAALGMMAMTHAKAYHRADEPGWSWLGRSGFKIFWDAPVLVVISGPIEDCCRAGQNLMLSAHARGLGTCWVGSPMLWLRTDKAKAALSIPPDLTPVSAICLGYPEAIPDAPPKKRPPIIWIA